MASWRPPTTRTIGDLKKKSLSSFQFDDGNRDLIFNPLVFACPRKGECMNSALITRSSDKSTQDWEDCLKSKATISGGFSDRSFSGQLGLMLKCHQQECGQEWLVCLKCIYQNDEKKYNKYYTVNALKRHAKKFHDEQAALLPQQQQTAELKPAQSGIEPAAQAVQPAHPKQQQATGNQKKRHPDASKNPLKRKASSLDMQSIKATVIGSPRLVSNKAPKTQHNSKGSEDVHLEFTPERNKLFYKHQFQNPPNGGILNLVQVSKTKQKLDVEATANIDHDQAITAMRIARLAFVTPNSDKKDELASLLHKVFILGCRTGYDIARDEINISLNAENETFMKDLPVDALKKKHFENFVLSNTPRLKEDELANKAKDHLDIVIPSNASMVRQTYTGNVNSIIRNLPHPCVKSDYPGGNMSYVDVVDCCRDFLAQRNAKFATLDTSASQVSKNINHTSFSSRAIKLAEETQSAGHSTNSIASGTKPLVSYLIFWKDDVDPGSTSMQGRAEVSVVTMTIATPLGDSNRMQNTYPIAVGSKKACLDFLENKISSALEKLKDPSTTFYIASKEGDSNKVAPVIFHPLVHLSDQPARRASNYLAGGNAQFHARFGISADHQYLYERRLKPCVKCYREMTSRLDEGIWNKKLDPCHECLQWDAMAKQEEGTHALAIFALPSNYPTDQLPADRNVEKIDGQLYGSPFEVTYDTMINAIKVAHSNYCDEHWEEKHCEAFLKVECLNDEIISRFLKHARATLAYNRASQMKRVMKDGELSKLHQDILIDQQKSPETYTMMEIPPQWRRHGVDLFSNVEAVMHLLFLGVVKKVLLLTNRILVSRNSQSKFQAMITPLSNALVEFKLDWMKAKPYKGKGFNGWISESYLAISRVCLWFFQNIGSVLKEKPQYTAPAKQQQKDWTAKENREWLRVRGLETGGKAVELSERVAQYRAMDQVPAPLPVAEVTGSDMELLMLSLSNVIQTAMSSTVSEDTIQKMDYAVRVFLTEYDNIERNVPAPPNKEKENAKTSQSSKKKKKKKKAGVVSSFNFMCLMNLPKVMHEFGPLRCLWEGKCQGEGYLPTFKRFPWSGIRKNWHKNHLLKLLRHKSFQNILPPTNDTTTLNDEVDGLLEDYGDNLETEASHEGKYSRLSAFSSKLRRNKSVNHLWNSIHSTSRKIRIMSCIIVELSDNVTKIYAVLDPDRTGSNTKEYVHEITIDFTQPTKKFGLHYYKLSLEGVESASDSEKIERWEDISKKVRNVGFAMLLPLLVETSGGQCQPKNNMRAIISSNHNTLCPGRYLRELIAE